LAVGCGGIVTARSDTLEWALIQAYQNNPSLNAQRAALRGGLHAELRRATARP
jgi:hypothetical protein